MVMIQKMRHKSNGCTNACFFFQHPVGGVNVFEPCPYYADGRPGVHCWIVSLVASCQAVHEGKELRVVGVCQLIPLQVRFLWPCLVDSGAWDEVRFPLVTVLVLLYVVMLQK